MAEPWKSWLKIWCCDVNAAVVLILKNEKEARINKEYSSKWKLVEKRPQSCKNHNFGTVPHFIFSRLRAVFPD